MFGTAIRQLRFAWSMVSGRRLPAGDLAALAEDMRLTRAEFGELGADASEMVSVQDPEMQADLTRRRLRRTVREAARDTPYYRWWFPAHGIDPATVNTETIALVAPTAKATLRETPAMFVSNRAEPAVAATTSGTTGVPTTVWFSRRELDDIVAVSALSLLFSGRVRRDDVLVNCVSSRSIASLILDRAVPMTGAAFMHAGLIDPAHALETLAAPLHLPGKAAQPTHLNTTSSYLAALVQEAESGGWRADDFGLREIHAGGEVLTDALRTRAHEVLGAPVTEGYSMTEILPVAGEVCPADHLHIPVDQGLVEVLDPVTYAPAGPGGLGVLTVTPYSMYRHTTTLVRYDTGDLVRTLPGSEPLTCPLAGVPATSRILGRQLTSHGPALTTRDVLDVLQPERALPLPTRYTVTGGPGGPLLHVVAGGCGHTVLARLEERVAATGLPLGGVRLVDTAADLPAPCLLRADLREHTFQAAPATPKRPATPTAHTEPVPTLV